jgi:glycosyltransferase involved in cell wall biosynthesis
MSSNSPCVSIGLPVFNGGKYLAETLESILRQTFSDFTLIISDNASADDTEEICCKYATRDCRIDYSRNTTNLGAAKNFNKVFELSSGRYFKWAAHDDLYAPEYLERCVEVLDTRSSVVICHTKAIYINEDDEEYRDWDDLLDFRSPDAHKRFHDYISLPIPRWNAIFGLIRASELKKTPLIGSYVLSDQVLLGELTLRGEVYRVPAPLFFRRDHPSLPAAMSKTRSTRIYAIWFDPANKNKYISPKYLKAFFEYLRAIRRVRLSGYQKTRCYLFMMKWGYKYLLLNNVNRAFRLLKSFEKQKLLIKRLILKEEK